MMEKTRMMEKRRNMAAAGHLQQEEGVVHGKRALLGGGGQSRWCVGLGRSAIPSTGFHSRGPSRRRAPADAWTTLGRSLLAEEEGKWSLSERERSVIRNAGWTQNTGASERGSCCQHGGPHGERLARRVRVEKDKWDWDVCYGRHGSVLIAGCAVHSALLEG